MCAASELCIVVDGLIDSSAEPIGVATCVAVYRDERNMGSDVFRNTILRIHGC